MNITCDNCGLQQNVEPRQDGSPPEPTSTLCRECHTPLAVPAQRVVLIPGHHDEFASHD
jgi:hypothetical protein